MDERRGTGPTLDELRAHRQAILALAERYGASNVRIFGSVARGEATPDSDIDLLVQLRPGTSLYEFSALWQDLRALLGREVNLLSEGGVVKAVEDYLDDLSEYINDIAEFTPHCMGCG